MESLRRGASPPCVPTQSVGTRKRKAALIRIRIWQRRGSDDTIRVNPPDRPSRHEPAMRPTLPLVVTALLAGPAAAAEPVSFCNDVMAVLSRAGCNAGACHGNLNGKGGL